MLGKRYMCIFVCLLLLFSTFFAMATGELLSSEETIYEDEEITNHYANSIRLESQDSISDGFNDTADGVIDVFLDSIEGTIYDGYNVSDKENVEPLDSFDSYNNLVFNTATTHGYAEVDTNNDSSLDYFNPWNLRDVRYSTNWLLGRQEVVEETYDDYALAKYGAVDDRNPMYEEKFQPIIDEHGITYAGDFTYAYQMIQDAMTDAMNHPELQGELRTPGESPSDFWQYRPPDGDWIDVETHGLIRIEDQRLEIGHRFSDLLEACGIRVFREEVDRNSAIPKWLFSDAADMEWGFYTGGWIGSRTNAYQHHICAQMYTHYYPYMPGDYYQMHMDPNARYAYNRDEPAADELYDIVSPLMNNRLPDEEAYWDTFQALFDRGVEESVRVFITSPQSFVPVNKHSVTDVAAEATVGWCDVFSPRTVRTTDGTFTSAQYSPTGELYISNWNNIGGSFCYYSNLQQRMSKDFATHTHPTQGTPTVMRADWTEVQRDYVFHEGELVTGLDIPDSDNVWFYDVQMEEWLNGGYTYEQTEEGADLVPRDTAATAVTYNFHLGTWHSGHGLTTRDILAWNSFSKQLSFGEDWDAPAEQYFHSGWGNRFRNYHLNVLAIEVVDEEQGIITYYGDHTSPNDDQVADYYADFPEVPWQLYEAASHLRGATPYADSSNTVHELYEWSDIEDTNQVHWLDPDQTLDLRGTLNNLADAAWIPPYLTHGPTPITETELVDEINAMRSFHDIYEHSWISQGPFMLTTHDPVNFVMEYERWTQADGYPFPPGGNQAIYTWEDLHNIRNDLKGHYTLMNDLTPDCSGYHEYASENADGGEGWLPLGNDTQVFEGTFQGNGYTISGLYIDRPETNDVGLFSVSDGSVKNLGLEEIEITGRSRVGALLGSNEGNIDNSYAVGVVNGESWNIGGLAGHNYGSIHDSHAYVAVFTPQSTAGGLVGQDYGGVITDSYAAGDVTGGGNIGGLVGRALGETYISRSVAFGDIYGGINTGGFVGWHSLDSTISDCYSTGDVTRRHGDDTRFGGFVGRNSDGIITDCYSTGSVEYANDDNPNDKGFFGLLEGENQVLGNFWDMETSGQTSSVGEGIGELEGKSTAEMKTQSTFTGVGWNFDETWHMVEDFTYPLLQWQELPEVDTMVLDLYAYPESDGWNFMSFNIVPLDQELTKILEDIEGSYDQLMYYDASADEWYSHVPGRTDHFNDLHSWDYTIGIWIRMNEDVTLNVPGTVPENTEITLYPGWNMIGVPTESAGNHGLPAEVEKIGYFDASAEYNLAYDHQPGQFIFEPGRGYQLYNAEEYPVTWTVSHPSAFVSTWNTEDSGVSNDDQIQLPLEESGTYDFMVDWGDGTNDHITEWDHPRVTHTYDEPGMYTVSITGTIEGWRFNNGGDRRKIIEISQWGPLNFGNSGGYFKGCLNLELIAKDAPDLTGTTNLEDAFQGCGNIGSAGNMNQWDVSQITNMENMFREAGSFDQDVSEWDVSNVTNMGYMFGATSFNQDISGWDVSNVEEIYFLFRLSSSFNQDLSSWDVSSVTNMYGMFYGTTSLDQDLGDWNVSNVSNMGNMLRGTALSTPNYDSLLIGWSQLDLEHGVDFHAGDTQYSSEAESARQYIIDEFGWSITDGGMES